MQLQAAVTRFARLINMLWNPSLPGRFQSIHGHWWMTAQNSHRTWLEHHRLCENTASLCFGIWKIKWTSELFLETTQQQSTSTLRQRKGRAPPTVHHVTMLCWPGGGFWSGAGVLDQRGVQPRGGVWPGWGGGGCPARRWWQWQDDADVRRDSRGPSRLRLVRPKK